MAYRLKILSGRHEGAELRLAPQRYSLGRGEDNTLILADSAIAEKHLSFFFADGELCVLSAAGGLRVDGKAVDSFPLDVEPLQVLTLAGNSGANNISFAFAEDHNKEWPDQAQIAALLANSSGTGADSATTKSRQVGQRQAESRRGALSRLSPQRRRLLARGSVAVGAGGLLVLAIVVLSLIWLDPVRRQTNRMRIVEKSLERELEAKPADKRTVTITRGTDDSYMLFGYVQTEKDLVRLRGLALESGLRVRVISIERLRTAIEVIAHQYGLYAVFQFSPIDDARDLPQEVKKGTTRKRSVNEIQKFRLRAEGFVESEERIEPFRLAVLQSLPYIVELDMDITTNEEMLDAVRTLFSKNAAFSGITPRLDGGQLVLSGAVFANFHDEMNVVLQQHFQDAPHPPTITDRLTIAPHFYAEITALLLGEQSAVDLRLRNNAVAQRFLVGEKIDEDIEILKIAGNGVLLRYREETLGFPVITQTATLQSTKPTAAPQNTKPTATPQSTKPTAARPQGIHP